MKISIYQGDITKIKVDAIVNAANSTLLGGGGVDGAIHRAAGPGLLAECRTLNGCETGEAKITKGYNLPAKFVIHTVGPIYSGQANDGLNLSNCYFNSLSLAKDNGIHSIAFPAISTGVYGYPIRDATYIATKAVGEWFLANKEYDIEVIFVGYNARTTSIYAEFLCPSGFQKITRYAELLKNDPIGLWYKDEFGDVNNGGQNSFVIYSQLANDFKNDFLAFCEENPKYDYMNHEAILDKNKIGSIEDISDKQIEKADAKCMIALITGAIRAERFCAGTFLKFIKSGLCGKCLDRLSEL